MDSITQKAYFRQRMVKYYEKHGGTATAIRYKTSRKTVYKWEKRHDGSIGSLKDKSHRPKSHPKAHTAEEIEQIQRTSGETGGGGPVADISKAEGAGLQTTLREFQTVMLIQMSDRKDTNIKKRTILLKIVEKWNIQVS